MKEDYIFAYDYTTEKDKIYIRLSCFFDKDLLPKKGYLISCYVKDFSSKGVSPYFQNGILIKILDSDRNTKDRRIKAKAIFHEKKHKILTDIQNQTGLKIKGVQTWNQI